MVVKFRSSQGSVKLIVLTIGLMIVLAFVAMIAVAIPPPAFQLGFFADIEGAREGPLESRHGLNVVFFPESGSKGPLVDHLLDFSYASPPFEYVNALQCKKRFQEAEGLQLLMLSRKVLSKEDLRIALDLAGGSGQEIMVIGREGLLPRSLPDLYRQACILFIGGDLKTFPVKGTAVEIFIKHHGEIVSHATIRGELRDSLGSVRLVLDAIQAEEEVLRLASAKQDAVGREIQVSPSRAAHGDEEVGVETQHTSAESDGVMSLTSQNSVIARLADLRNRTQVRRSWLVKTAREQDRAILLSFWASYCGPCIAELPLLAKLALEMEENVLVAGLAWPGPDPRDESRKLLSLLEANSSWSLQYMDIDSGLQRSLFPGTDALPAFAFFSSSGKLLWTHVGSILKEEECLSFLARIESTVAGPIRKSACRGKNSPSSSERPLGVVPMSAISQNRSNSSLRDEGGNRNTDSSLSRIKRESCAQALTREELFKFLRQGRGLSQEEVNAWYAVAQEGIVALRSTRCELPRDEKMAILELDPASRGSKIPLKITEEALDSEAFKSLILKVKPVPGRTSLSREATAFLGALYDSASGDRYMSAFKAIVGAAPIEGVVLGDLVDSYAQSLDDQVGFRARLERERDFGEGRIYCFEEDNVSLGSRPRLLLRSGVVERFVLSGREIDPFESKEVLSYFVEELLCEVR